MKYKKQDKFRLTIQRLGESFYGPDLVTGRKEPLEWREFEGFVLSPEEIIEIMSILIKMRQDKKNFE